MKAILSLAAAAAMLCSCSQRPQVEACFDVIPVPKSVTLVQDKPFVLKPSTIIVTNPDDEAMKGNAELLAEYIKEMTGMDLAISGEAKSKNAITLASTLQSDNPEAYELTVTPSGITINGASAAGTFYGIQTLRKAIPEAGDNNVAFPAGSICDAPRFGYRGTHFDVSRHFFPVDSIKAYIDILALHNVNRLHLHLTDDQGWRIEIKRRPLLTQLGSIRPGTCIGNDFSSCDSIPHGGFYTQEEARELVDYAAKRHITIVPEIDMPGHMLGALKAYPEMGCEGGPYELWTRWGVSEQVLCAGNDSTYALIDDILAEVIEIFPSEIIHIGGDECPKTKWKACPKCQAKIRQLGLKSDKHSTAEQKLQSHFMAHATEFLAAHGRRAIGWDEIVEGGLAPGVAVMSWRGTKGAQKAVAQGHDAVLTPVDHCYFDYVQAEPGVTDETLIGWAPILTLEKVYEFEPVDVAYSPEEAAHVLGCQANLWTERVPTFSYAEYKLLPRLAAMCEVQWARPEQKDIADFKRRLRQLARTYDALGLNYAKFVFNEPEPAQSPQ